MRALATDALRNFKFVVSIAGTSGTPSSISYLAFMTVSGLGIQNEVIPYREGGDNTTTRKMPGQTDFSPITFGRGAMAAPNGSSFGTNAAGTNELYKWMTQIFSVMEGQGAGSPTENFRSDITIDVLEHPDTNAASGAGVSSPSTPPIKLRFYVYNAWPMALNWGDLDAGGNGVLIETLQIAHEGFACIYASSNQPGVYVTSSQSGFNV